MYHHRHRVEHPDQLDPHGRWLLSWATGTAHGHLPTHLLRAHADDLTQWLCEHAVRATRTWRPGKANLHTYLETRARGMVADYWRNVGRMSRQHYRAAMAGEVPWPTVMSLQVTQTHDHIPPHDDPGYQRAEDHHDLHRALQRLRRQHPRIAHCVERYYLHGHTQIDIARDLGVDDTRVSQLIKQGRRILREHMT